MKFLYDNFAVHVFNYCNVDDDLQFGNYVNPINTLRNFIHFVHPLNEKYTLLMFISYLKMYLFIFLKGISKSLKTFVSVATRL